MKKLLTLCFPLRDGKILLGMKKRGFGSGWWNGFGGKVEPNETIEQAAVREVHEESGITGGNLQKHGVIEFTFAHDPKILEVHVFKLTDFDGTPIESDEMEPRWFEISEIPYDDMWSDDKYWLPLLLEGKMFRGSFVFDTPSDEHHVAQIVDHKLETVEHIA